MATPALSSQISSAVALALSPDPSVPQSTRHEAHLFLSQVKDAYAQTWQACLDLFLDKVGVPNEARLFAAGVVGQR